MSPSGPAAAPGGAEDFKTWCWWELTAPLPLLVIPARPDPSKVQNVRTGLGAAVGERNNTKHGKREKKKEKERNKKGKEKGGVVKGRGGGSTAQKETTPQKMGERVGMEQWKELDECKRTGDKHRVSAR